MRPGFHDGLINPERTPTCLELELMAMKNIPPNIAPTNESFSLIFRLHVFVLGWYQKCVTWSYGVVVHVY